VPCEIGRSLGPTALCDEPWAPLAAPRALLSSGAPTRGPSTCRSRARQPLGVHCSRHTHRLTPMPSEDAEADRHSSKTRKNRSSRRGVAPRRPRHRNCQGVSLTTAQTCLGTGAHGGGSDVVAGIKMWFPRLVSRSECRTKKCSIASSVRPSANSSRKPIPPTVSWPTRHARTPPLASPSLDLRCRPTRWPWSVAGSRAKRRRRARSSRCDSSKPARRAKPRTRPANKGFYYHFLDLESGKRVTR
jgi:hypothetical protein